MDWSWLTPPIAVALAGSITAVAAIFGALTGGLINLRVAKRQFESQERIAEAQRREDRELALLEVRRTAYAAALNSGRQVEGCFWTYANTVSNGQRRYTDWEAYRAAVADFRERAYELVLLAPAGIIAVALEALLALPDLAWEAEPKDGEDRRGTIARFSDAHSRLFSACIEHVNEGTQS